MIKRQRRKKLKKKSNRLLNEFFFKFTLKLLRFHFDLTNVSIENLIKTRNV